MGVRMLWMLAAALGASLLLWAMMTAWILLRQRQRVFRPLDRMIRAFPSDAGLDYSAFTLPVTKMDYITGWYVPGHASGGGQGWTIIFCHGNSGNIGGLVEVAEVMTGLGFAIVLFDYRGYGASSGRPGEAEMYADAEACYRYLVEQREVSPQRIIWFGHSLGAAVACEAALRCPADMLVLEGAFLSVPALAALRYPRLPVRRFVRIRYALQEKIGRVDIPVLVAHSRADEVCPFGHGETLFAAARSPKRFVEIAGGHSNGGMLTNVHYREALLTFAQECRHLPGDILE